MRRNMPLHTALEVGQSPIGSATLDQDFHGLRGLYGRLTSGCSALVQGMSRTFRTTERPPLILRLDQRAVRFEDPATFEFALIPRTQFPASRVARLIDWPAEDLQKIAAKIRQVEKRFAEAVAASVERPQIIGALLKRLDLKLFSQDHGWRDIVAALNRYDSGYDPYKKIALVKYTQYLRARQQILRSLYLEKRGEVCAPEPGIARRSGDEDTRLASSRDTGIFESTLTGANERAEVFAPLPRGETICLRFLENTEMTVRLSAHNFKLVAGKHFYLIDELGTNYLIRPGKNLVGRQAGCDVVLDPVFRGVSRKHMIIEPVSETVALVTDISSHGTYVPEQVS